MELKDAPENKIFFIEITNLLGKKGFIIETEKGISVVASGFDINIKQFASEEDAREFVADNKVFKKGKIRIVTNQEIAEKYAVSPTGEVYVVANEKNQNLFFDNGTKKYYFGDREVGCCAWFSKIDVDNFIKYRQPEFPHDVLIAVQKNDPGATPIN